MPPDSTDILNTSSFAAGGTTLVHTHNGSASSSTPRMCAQSRFSHSAVPNGTTCGQNCRLFWAEYRCSLSSDRCHFATSRNMPLPKVLSSSYRPQLPSSTSPFSTIRCIRTPCASSVLPSLEHLPARPPSRSSAYPYSHGRTCTLDVRESPISR